MLRLRLFFGLITLVLILWGVGAAALLLLHETSKPFDLRLQREYRIITAAHNLRAGTVVLNSHYLAGQAVPGAAEPVDRSFYHESKSLLMDDLATITDFPRHDEHWQPQVTALSQAIEAYFNNYETLFDLDSDERTPILSKISSLTRQVSDLTNAVTKLAEDKVSIRNSRVSAEVGKNTLYMVTLLVFGTIIAVIIYFQLVKHLVTPVMGLHQSIKEIRKGNFEFTVPSPAAGSEFSVIATAFNDMAAELKFRRAESDENLQRVNRINRAILESIPSPVFLVGDDQAVVQVNRPASKLTESLGVSGGMPVNIQRLLDQCRHTNTDFLPQEPQEAIGFRIDNRETYYLPRIFRFGNGDDSQSGWAVMLHNVSRIRWLDDMKTHLLATASHEIMTPMTSIRMTLLLLLEERLGPLTEKQREVTSSANGDCVRLLTALHNLLDFSRAEIGAIELTLMPLAVRSCIDRVISLFSSIAAVRHVTLRHENGLGKSPPPVLADYARFDEVLNNLVSNAIKHSPKGGTVILRTSLADPGFVRISVIDEGPGVPEESRDRIFERFFRAPGECGQGAGPGMFISREIMNAHDGRIGILERSGNTTEFYIDVPIAESPEAG